MAEPADIKPLYTAPVPIFLARTSAELPPDWLDSWCLRKSVEWKNTGKAPRGVIFRCERLDRLEEVLNGIDVKGGPIWAAEDLEKAWEYGRQAWESGGLQKLVLFLSRESLEPSYRVLDKDTPKDELERYKTKYPTQLTLEDGRTWLSRLNERQAGTEYEREYCWFPIGDPCRVLVAMMIVLSPSTDVKPIEVLLTNRLGPVLPRDMKGHKP
jgi:hypothetical protein